MVDNLQQNHLRTSCVVCGGGEFGDLYRPDRSPGPVVKCSTCGFVFVNPIETKTGLIEQGAVLGSRPDQLLYSSDLSDIDGSWEKRVIDAHLSELSAKEINANEALRHIEKMAGKGGRLLDFGCFCGVFLNVASQMGWDCYGIEPLVMPAIYARGSFNLRVVTDTLREDTFPSEFFDVVTSFQVFEHLASPDEELEKIHNILKSGGFLMIEVPNINTLTVKLLGSRHRHFVKDHVSFFSAETLGLLLRRTGFEVKEVFYPSRMMSLHHVLVLMARGTSLPRTYLSNKIPDSLLERSIRLNFGDIVTVIAQKV